MAEASRGIAFLACPGTLPGSAARLPFASEHDRQVRALRQGLEGSAVEVIEIDWHAPLDQITRFPLALIGTPWDYYDHTDAFLARLDALEGAGVQLCNPAAVARWNVDKRYLRDLADAGAPSIPTLWPDDPGVDDLHEAFAAFGCERIVVKRQVGAGAVGQHLFARDALPDAGWRLGHAAMIQPFLPAIASEGEYSLIFVDGVLSHALVKRAAGGDYRIQSSYGGEARALEASGELRDAAGAIVALLPFAEHLPYARIDLVRGLDGKLALIEAELIEPYLYPEQGPKLGAMLAAAVLRRLPGGAA